MTPYSPLSTLICAALLRDAGHTVALYDPTFADDLSSFEAVVREIRPSIVAIMEDNFNFLTKMCTLRRREDALGMVAIAKSHRLPRADQWSRLVGCAERLSRRRCRRRPAGRRRSCPCRNRYPLARPSRRGPARYSRTRALGRWPRTPYGQTSAPACPRPVAIARMGSRRCRRLSDGVESAAWLSFLEHGDVARLPLCLQLVCKTDLRTRLRTAIPPFGRGRTA